MSRKSARSRSKVVEWIGGLTRLSTTVEVAGVSIQPEVLLWMNEEGTTAGYSLGAPGTLLDTAVESLCEAMAHPMHGKAGLPQRLRVALPELAAALAELRPRIDIVCAPTPEIEYIMETIEAELQEDEPEPQTRQPAPSVGVETKAAVLQAVARLYKLKPWTVVPDFRHPIAVTVHHCSFRGGMVSLSRDDEGTLEVTLLGRRDDFDAMVAYKEQVEREDRELEALGDEEIDEAEWFNRPRLKMPPFVTLKFHPGTKRPAASPILAARKGGWEPVAPDCSIWFIARDSDRPARHPNAQEVLLMEAILLALPGILEAKDQLDAAWEHDVPFVRTFTAETQAGPLMVLLGAI